MPGNWIIRASNHVHWLTGIRIDPMVSYGIASEAPLAMTDEVRFSTPDGKDKVVRGLGRWKQGEFFRRGPGLARLLPSRWAVEGVSEDDNIAVLRFRKSRSADGIDVLVREGAELPEVRAAIANEPEQYRLSLEDFASLTWLPAQQGN